MGNTNSAPPKLPAASMMKGKPNSYPAPDFNQLFRQGVPKINQVADDVHRMTNCIMDLRNMMFGMVVLSVIGVVIFLFLKWWNDRRRAHRADRAEKKMMNGIKQPSIKKRPNRTYLQKPVDWSLAPIDCKIEMGNYMDKYPTYNHPPVAPKLSFQGPNLYKKEMGNCANNNCAPATPMIMDYQDDVEQYLADIYHDWPTVKSSTDADSKLQKVWPSLQHEILSELSDDGPKDLLSNNAKKAANQQPPKLPPLKLSMDDHYDPFSHDVEKITPDVPLFSHYGYCVNFKKSEFYDTVEGSPPSNGIQKGHGQAFTNYGYAVNSPQQTPFNSPSPGFSPVYPKSVISYPQMPLYSQSMILYPEHLHPDET